MLISTISNTALFDPRYAASLNGEVEVGLETLTTNVWSPSLYLENPGRRHTENFKSIQVLAYDVDNYPGTTILSLAKATQILKPYKHFIGTSKSHNKPKNGHPVAERFRIVLFFQEPITNPLQYAKNWYTVAKSLDILDSVDPAAKDVARFYYPCIEIVSYGEGLLLPVQAYEPEQTSLKKPTTFEPGQRGELSSKTVRFLLQQDDNGVNFHHKHVSALFDMKRNGYTQEEAVELSLKAAPQGTLDSRDMYRINDIYKNRTPHVLPNSLENPNQQNKEMINQSVLLKDITGEFSQVLYNPETHSRQPITTDAIRTCLGPKEAAKWLNRNTFIAKFEYNPSQTQVLFFDKDSGFRVFNQYEPPFWLAGEFYGNGEPVKKVSKPPQVIADFLFHLVNKDKPSYEYILDWLATAVRDRNLTVLTAIGEEGVGKGTLGDIMAAVMGQNNYVKVRSDVFKTRFNAQIENKRFVFVDEVNLKTVEEYNRFKDIVNNTVEIEKKGIDAKTITNYASYYIASNNNRAINPGNGDRRFSLINLTETKLKDTPLRDKIEEMKSNEVIEEFAGYLMHRVVKNDMMTPFKSESKVNEVQAAGLAEWEHYFIYEYLEDHVGETVSTQDIGLELVKSRRLFCSPGRTKYEKLAKDFPQYIKLKRRGKERLVEIIAAPTSDSSSKYENLQ